MLFDLDGTNESFGGGHERRQITFDRFEAVVRFPLDRDPLAVFARLKLGDSRYLRQVEHLGKFGADLSGLGVNAVLAAEDYVVVLVPKR